MVRRTIRGAGSPRRRRTVTIQGFFTDEGGPSGWFTVKSGIGVAKTTCIPGWPMWYRHSATLEIIYC